MEYCELALILDGQAQRGGGGKRRRTKPTKEEEDLALSMIDGPAPKMDPKDAIAMMLRGAKSGD